MSGPFLLGLTGSIGMGKSTTADMFRAEGVPVWDADATVHRLYARGGAAVPVLAAVFTDAVVDGAIDRARLKACLAAEPAALARLEALVHPLVAKDRGDFIQSAAENGERLVLLDVPLLFETGADRLMDATLVVSAPPEVQRARVLARPGMTEDLFNTILARQLPDAAKRARATYVIETTDIDTTRRDVKALIEKLRGDNA